MKPDSVTIIPARDYGEYRYYIVDLTPCDDGPWESAYPVIAWRIETRGDESVGHPIADLGDGRAETHDYAVLARSGVEAIEKAKKHGKIDAGASAEVVTARPPDVP